MDSAQLDKYLESYEGATLEFKRSLHFAENIARTLCGFANSFGGQLIVGVEKKDGKTVIAGIPNPDEEDQKLAQIMAQLNPRPYLQSHRLVKDEKTILVISVQPVPFSEVCFYKKTIYRRVGSINSEVTGSDVVTFLQQRGTISFEDNRSSASLSDLDENKIRDLLKNRGINPRQHEPIVWTAILGSLGVANTLGDFFLKNSAVFFFAKDITQFYMNPEVRVVKFKGKKKSLETREYDERLIDTLPELLSKVFKKVREKAGISSKIMDGKRVESPMIPDEVLREALTNAVGHRDYFDPNGITIEIYDDRIEVTNPGSLLPGLTLKNFTEVRKARNPVIHRLLNDSNWGESLNLGIKAMYRTMRQSKLPDPEFEELGGIFKVTLYGALSEKKARPYGQLNERQEKAIEYLQKRSVISAPQLAKIAEISHPTAIRDLNDLVAQGVLDKVGRYRSSKYILGKKDKNIKQIMI
ncbi:putative DNA binding domain-containing protein [Candidatus Micrarchaeota archaeon]|nr:putative DNA binding domain-containing protein [Candidatus Micrarchaeota archaeon]